MKKCYFLCVPPLPELGTKHPPSFFCGARKKQLSRWDKACRWRCQKQQSQSLIAHNTTSCCSDLHDFPGLPFDLFECLSFRISYLLRPLLIKLIFHEIIIFVLVIMAILLEELGILFRFLNLSRLGFYWNWFWSNLHFFDLATLRLSRNKKECCSFTLGPNYEILKHV